MKHQKHVFDVAKAEKRERKPGLAGRVQEIREDRLGVSREALARMADCSAVHIYRVEDGRSLPKSDLLLALSRSLGVSADWLLTGNDDAVTKTPPPEYLEFLQTPKGQTATPEEQEALLIAACHPPKGRAMTGDYLSVMLTNMRGALTPEDVENALDTAEKIRRLKK